MHTRSALMRIVAVAALLYSLGLFASSAKKLDAAEKDVAGIQTRLEALQGENADLKERLERLDSREGMEDLARERLGLVMPGEKIFYFTNSGADFQD